VRGVALTRLGGARRRRDGSDAACGAARLMLLPSFGLDPEETLMATLHRNGDENTRLVQRAYRAFGAGEVQEFLSLLAADVTWQLPEMSQVPFAGTWRGLEGVQKFLRILAGTQDIVEFQSERFVSQGDTVVALGRFAMRVKSTGQVSRSEWAHVWTVKNGQIAEFREYVDTAAVSAAHSAT
jgi:ketosteroid isomerase-like protein